MFYLLFLPHVSSWSVKVTASWEMHCIALCIPIDSLYCIAKVPLVSVVPRLMLCSIVAGQMRRKAQGLSMAGWNQRKTACRTRSDLPGKTASSLSLVLLWLQ